MESRSSGSADTPDLGWRKARRCSNSGCVEVKITDAVVMIRDSKDYDGGRLVFDYEEWRIFVAGVKEGDFDLPEKVASPARTLLVAS